MDVIDGLAQRAPSTIRQIGNAALHEVDWVPNEAQMRRIDCVYDLQAARGQVAHHPFSFSNSNCKSGGEIAAGLATLVAGGKPPESAAERGANSAATVHTSRYALPVHTGQDLGES